MLCCKSSHSLHGFPVHIHDALMLGNVGSNMMHVWLQVSIVNSSWTAGHIKQLWWKWQNPIVVFPPCNTVALHQLQIDRKLKRLYLISVAQFRPEKNHKLQLEAFAHARQSAMQAPGSGMACRGCLCMSMLYYAIRHNTA